jgi:hypothetical protein
LLFVPCIKCDFLMELEVTLNLKLKAAANPNNAIEMESTAFFSIHILKKRIRFTLGFHRILLLFNLDFWFVQIVKHFI